MKTLCTLLMLVVGIAVVGCGGGDEATTPEEAPSIQLVAGTQEMCPIMGNPIVDDSYVDYDGKRVYFCCAGCDDKFGEDPDKFIKEMEDAGVKLTEVVSK